MQWVPLPPVIEVYGDVRFNATAAADIIPEKDVYVSYAIGIQAFICTLWWIVGMFLYIP